MQRKSLSKWMDDCSSALTVFLNYDSRPISMLEADVRPHHQAIRAVFDYSLLPRPLDPSAGGTYIDKGAHRAAMVETFMDRWRSADVIFRRSRSLSPWWSLE